VPRALLIALLLLACPSFAADAAVSLEVPAGQSKSVRLRNLPSGTVLQVAIKSSGRLLVALVSAKQLKSPEGSPNPCSAARSTGASRSRWWCRRRAITSSC